MDICKKVLSCEGFEKITAREMAKLCLFVCEGDWCYDLCGGECLSYKSILSIYG